MSSQVEQDLCRQLRTAAERGDLAIAELKQANKQVADLEQRLEQAYARERELHAEIGHLLHERPPVRSQSEAESRERLLHRIGKALEAARLVHGSGVTIQGIDLACHDFHRLMQMENAQ